MTTRLFCSLLLLGACVTVEPTVATTPPADSDATPTAPAANPNDPVHLTLVATNDLHGWVMSVTDKYGQTEIHRGGLAAFGGYLKILRAENPDGVLLFDAGDIFQGTLASNITEGAVMIDAMNALGYDAAAVGNHEFDYGPTGAVSVATQPGVDPFGALKARILQARFPLLSTNIYQKDDGARPSWLPGDGMMITVRKGVKIGVVGLTTPQTPTTTVPVNVASLRFGSLSAEALTAAKRLRERGAEVVVALVHAGGKCGFANDPHDLSSCDTNTGEIFEMMEGLPPGTLDVVIAGHTHALVAHYVNGTPTIETYGLGKSFSLVDLWLDPKTHQVMQQKTAMTPNVEICSSVDSKAQSCDPRKLAGRTDVNPVPSVFHGRPVEDDKKVIAAVQPALDLVGQLQAKSLGLQVPSTLGRNYEDESPLGDFLADSLRSLEKADVALLNPGGLRADLKAGQVTYGAVYEVLPFDNAIATLQLTGDELKRVLAAAYGGRKGVFQVSGLEVKLSKCPVPDRLKEITLANGKPIEGAKKYRIVMPDFLARGGDGLGPVLSTIEPERVDLGESRELNLRDALVDHWQKAKTPLEAPKSGRVSFVADGDKCTGAGGAPSGAPGR
jgi:5'-nucleotidase